MGRLNIYYGVELTNPNINYFVRKCTTILGHMVFYSKDKILTPNHPVLPSLFEVCCLEFRILRFIILLKKYMFSC